MKLNNRRTILVGLAFLSICTFWQMYDSVMTLILTDTFKLNETFAGAIMAADNVLALFLLPFFGALSDRTNTKIGRRMPFILGGTAAAVILMNLLPLFDNGYANGASTGKLAMFVVTLGLLLVAMGTYRSPAVALMPDVTPKPLRSRANAIINLMGAVGGILYLGLAALNIGTVLPLGAHDDRPDYDYLDGVELHVYQLADGESETVEIPDTKGSVAATFTVTMKDGQAQVETDSTKPYTVVVHQ